MQCLTTLAESVDVLVHPSLEESQCMAVIEAMAMGLPVIAGKFSGAIPGFSPKAKRVCLSMSGRQRLLHTVCRLWPRMPDCDEHWRLRVGDGP